MKTSKKIKKFYKKTKKQLQKTDPIKLYMYLIIGYIAFEAIKQLTLIPQYLQTTPIRPEFQTKQIKEMLRNSEKSILSSIAQIGALIMALNKIKDNDKD